MNETAMDIQVSAKRWVVLLCVVLLTILYVFTILSFGPINNIVIAYFGITYAISDWIVLSSYIGGFFFFPIIAWYAYTERLNMKRLLLCCSIAFSLTCVCDILAFWKPNLFGLIILGQLFIGVVQSAYSSFPGTVATLWFPDNQIGMVTGIVTMGWNTGMLLSEFLLENILENPPAGRNNTEIATSEKNWFLHDQRTVMTLFIVLLICALTIFVTIAVTIPELPDQPPSIAQAAKRLRVPPSVIFSQFLRKIKELLTDRVFVKIQLLIGITIQTFVLETLIMQELIKSILPLLTIKKPPSILTGYVLACRSVGDMIGSAIGGKLLDSFQRYRLQTIIGSGLAFVVIFGLFVSYYFASFIGLCLSMFLFGVSTYVSVPPLYDAMLQHTYPLNVITVSSIGGILRFCLTIAISEIGRLFLQFKGPLNVLIFHCALQLAGFVLSFFVKPTLNRSKQEYEGHVILGSNEGSSLLNN